ncbi:hypothetical protein QR685DRAFT_523062 [Neurospora intermedia]|uniref:Secreted protein n=1 Tax=Neurospora intermedia TaxID=5142 RepID=A0ABR3DD47_NEUIN
MVLVFHFHFHLFFSLTLTHKLSFIVLVILFRTTDQNKTKTDCERIILWSVVANAGQRIFPNVIHPLGPLGTFPRHFQVPNIFTTHGVLGYHFSLGQYPVSFRFNYSVQYLVSDYLRTLLRIRLRCGTSTGSAVQMAPSISHYHFHSHSQTLTG